MIHYVHSLGHLKFMQLSTELDAIVSVSTDKEVLEDFPSMCSGRRRTNHRLETRAHGHCNNREGLQVTGSPFRGPWVHSTRGLRRIKMVQQILFAELHSRLEFPYEIVVLPQESFRIAPRWAHNLLNLEREITGEEFDLLGGVVKMENE
jgi:hypothetical protein